VTRELELYTGDEVADERLRSSAGRASESSAKH
jgi:hypothetical protein